jgi:hypothetical protein
MVVRSLSINRIGTNIVGDRKAMLLQEDKDGTAFKGRDLLTLLIKSNMAQESNGGKGNQTMSDEEVLGRA